MKKYFALLTAAALLVALVWLLWPSHEVPDAAASSPSIASQPMPSTPAPALLASPPAQPAEVSHLADHLNAPTGTIIADLHVVADVLENFRSNFPRDGNPVGNNADITAALTGKNRLRYAALPPNHPAINRDGELCDRWGMPFFFHAESATRMTIRSAGADKKMWTADDLELTP